jgi:hypothetical protein
MPVRRRQLNITISRRPPGPGKPTDSASDRPMKKPRILRPAGRKPVAAKVPVARQKRPYPYRQEAERLRRRLAQAEAELELGKRRQKWLESALAAQRHARQVLEAAVSASYSETVARIGEILRATVPSDAVVLVVSRGDDKLLNLHGGRGWHFPRGTDGGYAGYYPADSAAAIEHLQSLIGQGGQFLLLPQTAFWWLEHYRGLEEHLSSHHVLIWRDERCAIYRLEGELKAEPGERAERRPAFAALGEDQAVQVSSPDQYDVICFPVIDWGYRFQRPQQLMRQFAAAGHRVFYVSHQFRKSGEPYALRQMAENLWEVALRGPRFNVHEGVLDDESCEALLASLSALRQDRTLGATASIVQLPFWWPLVKQAAEVFKWPVVYDCMDYQAGFSTSHPLAVDQERELFARVRLVVTASAWLEAHARRYNRNVLLVRNACDYEHFAKVPPRVRGARPVIGYYGAIAEWFDSDLVADLAERRPDWDFILVGSTLSGELRRLSQLSHVSLPGERPYGELPAWLAKFDVTILPFKRTPLTEATNPVKAYEIFATGRPLVTVPLPEMLPLVPLARLAATAEEFEHAIELELGGPDARMEARRRAFARENTWRDRFEALAPAIRAQFSRKTGCSKPVKPSEPRDLRR